MVQPNELRIGNWIIGSNDGIGMPNQIQQVFALEENYINQVYDHQGGEYYIKPEDANGIELTEEILLKCGFGYEKHREHFDNGIIGIYLNHQGKYFPSIEYDHNGIEYVHQLQNWQFALTGTELSIDLSS